MAVPRICPHSLISSSDFIIIVEGKYINYKSGGSQTKQLKGDVFRKISRTISIVRKRAVPPLMGTGCLCCLCGSEFGRSNKPMRIASFVAEIAVMILITKLMNSDSNISPVFNVESFIV